MQDGKIAASELGLLMRSLGRAPTEQEVKDFTAEIAGSGSFDFEGLKGCVPAPLPPWFLARRPEQTQAGRQAGRTFAAFAGSD